jgi:hypothetical protein
MFAELQFVARNPRLRMTFWTAADSASAGGTRVDLSCMMMGLGVL